MNVVFFESDEHDKDFFHKSLPSLELSFYPHTLTLENIAEAVDAEIVCTKNDSVFTPELLGKLPKLTLVTTRSTGFDHIDIEYCKSHGITVSNVPEYGKFTVAEHTIALLLAISRKIIESVERTKQGDFRLDGLSGFDLYGKTIGIIGAGNIGQEVIKRVKAFGMKVLVYTHGHDESLAKELGFSYVDLSSLLRESDIVSLHVPYSKETHHLINQQNIHEFKKGSILINTARGGVCDTEAILLGLDQGILRACGLDVLEEECYVMDEMQLMTPDFLKTCDLKTQLMNHVLLKKKNVIITPHNAFNSVEALQRILDTTVKNIQAFVDKKPINVVG